MGKKIVIIGTLDTKGEEHLFLRQKIEERGFQTTVVDTGLVDPPYFKPDISREEVCRAAGLSLADLIEKKDKTLAIDTMGAGAGRIASQLYTAGNLDGIISLGGGQGTLISTAAMRSLPYGVPKVMVSTIASGDVSRHIGIMDITMIHSIVDILGLNSFSKKLITQAGYAVCAMVEASCFPPEKGKPLIGMTMFGITTPCAMKVKKLLAGRDLRHDVLVFHARGTGGRTMEKLITEGAIRGVVDISTTELADELVGGIRSAGPHRLEAAAAQGIPQVVCPGALDSVNFGPPESVPAKFRGRKFSAHSSVTTLMRTTPAENETLGEIIAEKLNRGRGKTTIVIPLQGFSVLDKPGGPFYDPEATAAFIKGLKRKIDRRVKVLEIDAHLTDDRFAEAVFNEFIQIMD
ncbi:MAG: Tm-1-like ATP-binding domain-containing protein [Deltaproteobacteria bacterium]|nr:Tm-1-like ATP-binding domain-containing protein [Deltaproteobacteria bacterium]